MNNTYKFCIFITILFSFLMIGCEKADLQKSVPNTTTQLDTRGDCDECPGANECCCIIEWLSGSETGEFSICGTSDGDAVTCTASSTCENDIDGLEHTFFELNSNSGHTYEKFCMDEGMAFKILRTDAGGQGTVYARVSCTADQGSPQWKLVSFTADGRVFFDVDEDCLLTECD